MRPAALLASSLALLVPLAALAAKAPPRPIPAGPGPAADVRSVTFGNGLRLLLAPDPEANAVEVATFFPRREPPGRSGIAHLFERLRSGSSSDPQAPERLVQAEGGSAAAWSAPDLLCFEETVPPAALDAVLRLEGDRLANLALDPAALERRKREVADERSRIAAALPIAPALEAAMRMAWTAHPYRVPSAGLEGDVARITVADCVAWHRDRLGPRDALVVVVGAFDPARALESAKRWLEPVKARRAPPLPVAAEPPQVRERRTTERVPLPGRQVVVGWKLPPHADADGAAFAVLARILAPDPGSRLQQALGGDPLRCVAVQATLESRRDGGLLFASAVARSGADTAAVERALFAETDRLAREPVPAEELDRARKQEEVATIAPWQTVQGRAEALGQAVMLDGDWTAAAARLARLRALTPEDLRRAAARVLVPAGRNVLWTVPEPAAAGSAVVPAPAPEGDR